jgi:hypothetical protein
VSGRKTTHEADRGSLLAQYAAQYWQSVQRKEAIKVAPIAKRRTSILALTATFGLVLIVTGGTVGYRWTYPHTADEVTPAARKADRLVLSLPKPGPAPEAANEASPEQQVAGQLRPQWVWQQAVPIISQRSESDVLAVFRRLQEEQPSLFGQATLKRTNPNRPAETIISSTTASTLPPKLDLRMIYTAQVGPFASVKDAEAACRVLQAADIRCVGVVAPEEPFTLRVLPLRSE